MLENVSTYEVVPAGFNLLDAPPDQLDRYGIPQRPDAIAEPSLFEFWKKLVSQPFHSRQPEFSSLESVTTSSGKTPAKAATTLPSKPRRARKRPARGIVEWKWNWSGALVSPPWPKRIVFATAKWLAPEVSPPSAQ